ncbi:MAG: drug resistance transporter, EmrB/QacA subfamily [Verrucomicrobia bacterium]|nr:drug resistance transporter, EmrB/QacA subfamily [Verrucomicrobiota bacterium]
MHDAVIAPPGISAETRRFLPWLVAVALFMENLDATIVNTAVPTMAQNLAVTPLSLKSVLTSYTLSLAVFIPISGWMADRFGTKRVFTLAIALFILGSLFCGLAMNVPMLTASRVLQGMGGAMMTPVGRLALVRTFPRSEMLTAMNYVVVPALIGPLVGPFVGGLIVHWLHWRVIFFLNLPFGAVGLWMVSRHMPDFNDPTVGPLDRVGFVLFGAGVALLSYVLEIFGEHRLPLSAMALMLATSALLLAAYGWHMRRVPAPLLSLGLFGIRTFRISVVGGFVTRIGIGGMPFLLPLLYQIGLGYKPWQAGLLTMPQALAAIGMKIFSKRLLARFGYRQVLLANTVLLGLTITAFTRVGPGTPLAGILVLSLVQGFFSSLQFTSMNSLVYADVNDRDASKASSISSTGQQMSLCFGVAFASLLTAWFLGHVDQTVAAETIPALHKAYLVMGLLTITSSLVFIGLHNDDGNNVSNRAAQVPEVAAEPA